MGDPNRDAAKKNTSKEKNNKQKKMDIDKFIKDALLCKKKDDLANFLKRNNELLNSFGKKVKDQVEDMLKKQESKPGIVEKEIQKILKKT